MDAMKTAAAAFRNSLIASSAHDSNFDDFSARLTRYEMDMASYESTTFLNINTWAQGYRNQRGLYRYIRELYSPKFRDTEFFKSVIWAGSITPGCIGGAIPVEVGEGVDENRLRAAITNLMTLSNFDVNKGVAVMHGTNTGDVGLRIVDDVAGGRAYLEVVPASIIRAVTLDNRGFVKAYALEESRTDEKGADYTYMETAERDDGENVIYRTYRDGNLFAYEGQAAEWSEPYGFIPFVKIKHLDVGGDWGWAELHAKRGLVDEINDQASVLNDNIRRQNNAPALIAGMSKPTNAPETKTGDATTDKPQPGREELKTLWSEDADTSWTPMVMPIDIANGLQNIERMLTELENNYPELKQDIWSLGGDPSGEALKVARQPVEAKVNERRVNYDSGLVRAMQMCIAIGGWRGYPGYDGFDLNSYAAGKLNFAIKNRPVFPTSEAETLGRKDKFWTGWAAVADRVPFEAYARDYGWGDEQIAAYDKMLQGSYTNTDGL